MIIGWIAFGIICLIFTIAFLEFVINSMRWGEYVYVKLTDFDIRFAPHLFLKVYLRYLNLIFGSQLISLRSFLVTLLVSISINFVILIVLFLVVLLPVIGQVMDELPAENGFAPAVTSLDPKVEGETFNVGLFFASVLLFYAIFDFISVAITRKFVARAVHAKNMIKWLIIDAFSAIGLLWLQAYLSFFVGFLSAAAILGLGSGDEEGLESVSLDTVLSSLEAFVTLPLSVFTQVGEMDGAVTGEFLGYILLFATSNLLCTIIYLSSGLVVCGFMVLLRPFGTALAITLDRVSTLPRGALSGAMSVLSAFLAVLSYWGKK